MLNIIREIFKKKDIVLAFRTTFCPEGGGGAEKDQK